MWGPPWNGPSLLIASTSGKPFKDSVHTLTGFIIPTRLGPTLSVSYSGSSLGRKSCLFSLSTACACVCVCVCVCVRSLRYSFVSNSVTPWTVACQAPLSMGFPRQEYWSGLPCPPPRIEPVSPAWQVDSLPLSHLGPPFKCTLLKLLFLSPLLPLRFR